VDLPRFRLLSIETEPGLAELAVGVCECVVQLLVLGPEFADALVSEHEALAQRLVAGAGDGLTIGCRVGAVGL
jgi:hypothetical protein